MHAWPQPPQLFESDVRSTHSFPQAENVVPPKPQYEQSTPPSDDAPPQPADACMPHVWAHNPPMHVCPAAHTWPQPPQLLKSDDVSVQNAVAFVPPPVHADCPEGQLEPLPQKPLAQ